MVFLYLACIIWPIFGIAVLYLLERIARTNKKVKELEALLKEKQS